MPRYDYACEANGQVIEVTHSLTLKFTTWGELCAHAGLPLGDVAASAPIERIITTAPMANTPTGNVGLKNLGFTKLEKRDDGVYENMTRSGTEKRYMDTSDLASMPNFRKKLGD